MTTPATASAIKLSPRRSRRDSSSTFDITTLSASNDYMMISGRHRTPTCSRPCRQGLLSGLGSRMTTAVSDDRNVAYASTSSP